MKRNILAICDPEEEYAYHLMDYLSRKEDFPFEVQVFTSCQRLKDYLCNNAIALLAVSQTAYQPDMKDWQTDQILVLKESDTFSEDDVTAVSKYIPVERIVQKILELSMDAKIPLPQLSLSQNHLKIIGIYTPVGRCLQTSFAFVLGQLLARNHRVLYLNFESYSGLGKLLKRQFEADLSDLMYYLNNIPGQFLFRLQSMTEKIGGLEMVPPMFSCMDLMEIEKEEWLKLFEVLEESSYDYLILDLSDALQGLFDILRNCHRIYTITREDGFAQAKIEQYERLLSMQGYEDILDKTRKCPLPVFKKLPRNLSQMNVGELADYVKELLKEKFYE